MAEIVDFGLQRHKIKMDSRYFENVLSVVAGDTGRRLEVQLLDTNGMVQDTTGLNLRLNAEIAGKATFTDATLVDATTGKYQLDLSNGMFLAPGNWQFQWLITDSAGKKLHSFAFTGNIGKNISEGGSQATNFYLNLEDLKAMQDDLVNGTIDSSILETTITEKLTDLETQYAPKLTEVSAQLAQTLKQGEVSVSDIDKNKGLIDETFLTDTLKQQMAGTTPIHTVPANESLTTQKFVDKSVTKKKVDFVRTGKNLFNIKTITPGVLLSSTTGNTSANASYFTSDYIEVDSAEDYTENKSSVVAFYDAEKAFVSGISQETPYVNRTFKTPANAKYLRVSMTNFNLDIFQIEKGLSATEYEPYRVIVDDVFIEEKNISEPILNKLDKAYEDGVSASNKFERVAVLQDIYENETTSGNTGAEQNNTSTFSGWGSPVGVRQNFDTVAFFIRSWDITRPITQVRVLIKENDSLGSILADKTVDVNTPFNELKEVTVRLDSEVVNSLPLWVEYHANGRTGYLGTSSPQYPNTTYPRLRYSTRSSVTDLTMVESSANLNIYYEFKKYVGDKIRATNEFVESLDSTENLPEVDHYGKHHLKNWQSVASQFESETTNQRLELAILGDSWVRTSARITKPLRDKLKVKYGNGGIGFVGFAEIRLASAETQIETTGTWETINGEKGLDRRQYESTQVGATIKLTTYEPSKKVSIHHIQQVGSYRYRINSGAWITVDTSTSTFTETSSFTQGNVILEIEVLSGKVTLLNAYLYNEERGAVVHQWGYGGAKADSFTEVDRSHFISELQKTNIQTVGILLGTNDMAQNVPIETFKQNITEIIGRIKESKPIADVFLISPTANNLTGRLHTMEEYDNALHEVARAKKVGYVSLYKNFGTFAESSARGLFEDDVHPNAAGGRIIGNIVNDRLLRV